MLNINGYFAVCKTIKEPNSADQTRFAVRNTAKLNFSHVINIAVNNNNNNNNTIFIYNS